MAKILIIEDDNVLADMYKLKFEESGYETVRATDGEKGLEISLNEHPDLILLDIRLPKLDGISVMHKLREDPWGKNAKIIILTNLDTDDNRLTAVINDQPSYYLIKINNTPEQVLEKINELLDNSFQKQ